jgi:hypothetical protein
MQQNPNADVQNQQKNQAVCYKEENGSLSTLPICKFFSVDTM